MDEMGLDAWQRLIGTAVCGLVARVTAGLDWHVFTGDGLAGASLGTGFRSALAELGCASQRGRVVSEPREKYNV
jgi:hypothetical protein